MSAGVRIERIEQLRALVGTELGVSEWHEIAQADVDRFAEATGDRQWIHVDPTRAEQSPFGGTIAHGLLTLSLGPVLTYALLDLDAVGFTLNYGYDRVRFPAPLPTGSRVRMRLALKRLDERPDGAQLCLEQTFEADGATKPVCVAEALARLVAR